MTYMPRGQWPACLREAYSSDTAVRVTAELLPPWGSLTEAVVALNALELEGIRDEARDLRGLERSIVGEATRPLSMDMTLRFNSSERLRRE